MDVHKRLKLLIETLGLNITTFSKEIGLANNVTILRIVKHGNSPSYKVTVMIKSKYPNLNLNWFLFNEGEMWLDKLVWESEEEGIEENKVLDELIKKQLNTIKEDEEDEE